MDRHVEAFLEMLAAERGAARNTLLAYQADLDDFAAFAAARGQPPAACDAALLQAYMAGLQRAGLSARTASRRLSALRQFHRFLLREGVRDDDPDHAARCAASAQDAAEIPERAGGGGAAGRGEAHGRAAWRGGAGGAGDPLRDRAAGVGTAGVAAPRRWPGMRRCC